MNFVAHKKYCTEAFGEPYTEVHIFLDSYSDKYRGSAHRRLLHHKLGVELCVKKFGESARKAAELHIRQDYGFIPRTWKDAEQHVLLLGDEDTRQKNDLVELYGKELYQSVETNTNSDG